MKIKTNEPLIITQPFPNLTTRIKAAEYMIDACMPYLPYGHDLYNSLSAVRSRLRQPQGPAAHEKELNEVAVYGIHLATLEEQGWNIEDVVQRATRDSRGWRSHLHEAAVAHLFSAAGCDGEFIRPISSEQGRAMLDLRVSYGNYTALVECRRGSTLTAIEQRSHQLWASAADAVLSLLAQQLPSAMVKFEPTEQPGQSSADRVVTVSNALISKYAELSKELPTTHLIPLTGTTEEGDFKIIAVVGNDADQLFDLTVNAGGGGVDVPAGDRAVALRLALNIEDRPRCTAMWYVTVHRRRDQQDVQKRILRLLDDKVSQVNRYKRDVSENSSLPAIVWIEPPGLTEASSDEIRQLIDRIQGKISSNQSGRFDGIAGVVISNSRLILTKNGAVNAQYRVSFVTNPEVIHPMNDDFPFLTWKWVDRVRDGDVRPIVLFGNSMQLAMQ